MVGVAGAAGGSASDRELAAAGIAKGVPAAHVHGHAGVHLVAGELHGGAGAYESFGESHVIN